jgi:DNA-binding LacI/PurR family transcriptional regulator
MKNLTIKQIAEKAGVSIATVSRVMNHKSTVREDTKQKILDIMEQYNVNPSSVLITDQSSRTLLQCVPDLANPIGNLIFEGVQKAAYANNYRVLILKSKESYFTLGDYEDILQNHSFAGLLLFTSVADKEILELLDKSCPMVICSDLCESNISFVNIDNMYAAKKATEYLISCGCKKIALINSLLRYNYAQQRELGFREALQKAKLPIRENWITHVPGISYDLAFSYISNIIRLPNRPDGIFAVSDVYAIAAIHAAKKQGLRVPKDISIIGFDNIEVSAMVDPPLTTIRQPCFQMGYQACELLIEKIINPKTIKKQLFFETELIVRESTAYKS